jgi:hypothetical protein
VCISRHLFDTVILIHGYEQDKECGWTLLCFTIYCNAQIFGGCLTRNITKIHMDIFPLLPTPNTSTKFQKLFPNVNVNVGDITYGILWWATSLVVWWSERLTTIHEVSGSITGFAVGIFPHNTGWGVQIMKLLMMKFSPLPCYLVPLRPNILLNTLFSNTLRLRCQRPSFTPIQTTLKYVCHLTHTEHKVPGNDEDYRFLQSCGVASMELTSCCTVPRIWTWLLDFFWKFAHPCS